MTPLSNPQVAALIDCHFSTVSRLRRGVYVPSLGMAMAIERVLGLPALSFIDAEPEERAARFEKALADYQEREQMEGTRVFTAPGAAGW